jgi:LPS-assembly lipoprotein
MSWFRHLLRDRSGPHGGSPEPAENRRRFVYALPLILAGCGFHLRGEAAFTFDTVFVNGAGAPTIAAELRRALSATGNARLVDDPKNAQVIVDFPFVADDKEVLSISGSGAVREYLLTKRVQFRVHGADGDDWLPQGEIALRRAYTYSESEVLARNTQEQRLLKEMEQDAVQQLVRRLQAAKKPA